MIKQSICKGVELAFISIEEETDFEVGISTNLMAHTSDFGSSIVICEQRILEVIS